MAESQQSQYPNLNPRGLVNSAQNTMSSIANSDAVQNLQNGPVAEKARAEANATKSEFSNLASSRTTPSTTAANGQPLTHYHSFFYNLLSWQNPRATAISYVTTILAIFIVRYVPIAHYTLRGLWIVLGSVGAAELVFQLALGQSATARIRPKQYLTIPREKLEASLEDVEQLINFFVIEFQRVLFAENVYATIAAFFATLSTYFLIKVTPTWGLGLLFTTVVYFAPLAYLQNKELIDGHLQSASRIASDQSAQIRSIAQQHTQKAVSASQSALKDYSTKAQEIVVQAKQTAVDKGIVSPETVGIAPASTSAPVTASTDAPVIASTHIEPLDSSSTHATTTDGAADLIDTKIPTSNISEADTKEILGTKTEDFPAAPTEELTLPNFEHTPLAAQ